MLAHQLVPHSTVCTPLRFQAALDRVSQAIGGHDKAHNNNLLRLSGWSRWFLDAISDAVKDAVYYFVVGKTIDKEFRNRERLDKRLVAHCNFPAAHQRRKHGKHFGHTANQIARDSTYYVVSRVELESNRLQAVDAIALRNQAAVESHRIGNA